MSTQSHEEKGILAPHQPIVITVTRGQAWAIYDLLIAEAAHREKAEHDILGDLGSGRYRAAATALRTQLL